MKKESRTVKSIFPTGNGDTGHAYKTQDVVQDKEKTYIDLEYINIVLEGTGFEFELFPIFDQHQKLLTKFGKYIKESR